MEPEYTLGAFTGFKEILPNFIQDWVFGGETGVKTAPRNDSFDWRPSAPTYKSQLMKVGTQSYGDTNACTDFSGTNDLAVQLDWLIAHGQIDPNAVTFLKSNGYFDDSGKINFSPRFTAVMSGTTPAVGNTLPAVWDSMRNDGLVPDGVWPMPSDQFAQSINNGAKVPDALWEEYYSPIPENVQALGKQFTQWFDVQYEWAAWPGGGAVTPSDFTQLLAGAPLQIATAVCAGWNTEDPIQACGAGSAHATTLLYVDPTTSYYDILDHYNPFMKQFSPTYNITHAMRGVISSKVQNPTPPAPFVYDYQINLALGVSPSAWMPEIHALQQGLQTALDKTGKPYMAVGVFGPFGPQTQAALGRFQVDQGIADAPQGHDFGPASRAALTAVLKQMAADASGEPLPRPLAPGSQRPN